MKTWNETRQDVEKSMVQRFNEVPIERRRMLGIEPGTDPESYERRQWVQTYVEMLSWREKCRELHEQLHGPTKVPNKKSIVYGPLDD